VITAVEAKKATEENIKALAKEFVDTRVSARIQEAISDGKYGTSVTLIGLTFPISNPEAVGPEIVSILEEAGYKVEFKYCNSPPKREAYVLIDWSLADSQVGRCVVKR
jgi:hypothetical protein